MTRRIGRGYGAGSFTGRHPLRARSLTPVVAVIVLSLTVTVATDPGGASAAGSGEFCGPGWQRVSTPQVQKMTRFTGLAGVRDDLWAVGYHARGPSATTSTLAAHWDGSSWTEVATPDPGDRNWLFAAAAIAPDDVWAVGTADNRAVAVHWNGSTWTATPMPNPPSAFEELWAVDAVSSDDVWAVGRRGSTASIRTLTMHWNGTAWSVVAAPDPGADGDHLLGIDAVSEDDAWAFGSSTSGSGAEHGPLLLHWNGTAWSTAATGDVAAGTILMTGAETPGGDLWTGGGSWAGTGPSTGVVQRRRGVAWTSWPNPATRWEALDAVSGGDVWVAGEGQRASLTAHWDGAGWTPLAVPAHLGPGAIPSLKGIVAVAPDEIWAVGGAEPFDSSYASSLALRLCPIEVGDGGFSKLSSRVGQGSGTLWRFSGTGPGPQDVTDALGLGTGGAPLFTTGARPAGSTGTFVLPHAGAFAVRDGATGHTAELTVPTEAHPKKAPLGTSFTILTSAMPTLPAALGSDIRYRRPGSEFWNRLVTSTGNGSTTFTPDRSGTYTFQSRLRNKTTGAVSGWSPFATITATAP